MTRRFPDCVPLLRDGRVLLRAHRADDLPAIVEQCNDVDMLRYTTVPRPYGPDQAAEFLARVKSAWEDRSSEALRCWAVSTVEKPNVLAGTIDYRPDGAGMAVVGFGLHPAWRGRRLMSAALGLVADHAFSTGVEVLQWRAVAGNWASAKTAWRSGFRLEGQIRGLCSIPGSPPVDGWIATLCRGDGRQPCQPWPWSIGSAVG
ncbi:GNAT family N-acetyltransferase [Nocardia stercoris]